MRLIVARCEVVYTGRLNAFLPESTRLVLVKADGSVLVHADAGGYKPLNWMTPPTAIEEEPGLLMFPRDTHTHTQHTKKGRRMKKKKKKKKNGCRGD